MAAIDCRTDIDRALGPAVRTFRQTVILRLAVTLFLFLPIQAFFVFVVVVEHSRGGCLWPWILGGLIWLGLCCSFWRAVGKTTLTIHPGGIRSKSVLSETELRWDDIVEYRYQSIPIDGGLIGGVVGSVVDAVGKSTGANRSLALTLVGRQQRLSIDSNVRGAAEAITLALAKVHERLAPGLTHRLACGETVRFNVVELGPKGVSHVGEQPIDFDAIASVELLGTRLRIKEVGSRFARVSLDMVQVPNVILFLDSLRSRAHGVRVPELRPS